MKLPRGSRGITPSRHRLGCALPLRDCQRIGSSGKIPPRHSADPRQVLLRLPRKRFERRRADLGPVQVRRSDSRKPRIVGRRFEKRPRGPDAAEGRRATHQGRSATPRAVDQDRPVSASTPANPDPGRRHAAAAQPRRVSQHDPRPDGLRLQHRRGVSARRHRLRLRQHRRRADRFAAAVGKVHASGRGDCRRGGAYGVPSDAREDRRGRTFSPRGDAGVGGSSDPAGTGRRTETRRPTRRDGEIAARGSGFRFTSRRSSAIPSKPNSPAIIASCSNSRSVANSSTIRAAAP